MYATWKGFGLLIGNIYIYETLEFFVQFPPTTITSIKFNTTNKILEVQQNGLLHPSNRQPEGAIPENSQSRCLESKEGCHGKLKR